MKALFIFLLSVFCGVCSAQADNSEMALIPAGEFTMGKNTPNPTDWQPEHKVKMKAFYMDKYEVTNKQYYEFCISTKTPLPQFWDMKEFRSGLEFADYPVVGVSYIDAEKYAKWKGKRLPTEAEWEYAARGGLEGKNFPLGDMADSTTINFGRKYKGILKSGSFPANGYGLFDITGNVWEWTSDFYDAGYYAISTNENPPGPERGRFKVIRGGSWHSGAMCVQTYYRNGLPTSWVDFAVGFRCVQDIK
jgi:iron(II)-dependent oxidoreductase